MPAACGQPSLRASHVSEHGRVPPHRPGQPPAALNSRLATPFTRAETLAAGNTTGTIKARLRSGEWCRLRTGVYVERAVVDATAGDPAARHAVQVAAALLVVPHAVASGWSAAWLHGLPVPYPPTTDVVLTRSRVGPATPARMPGIRLHVAELPRTHLTTQHGVPVTTVARTVVDCARALTFRDAVIVTDAALHAHWATATQIETVRRDCAGWPGIRAAARATGFADPAAESPLESASRVFFAEHGIPAPKTQHWLGDAQRRIGRVDFYWPEHRTVGEADGLSKHIDPDVLRAEKLRQERLEEAGFVVVRFSWRDIGERPRHTVARIRAAFARGSLLASETG
jgi:AbiEi antitoxin C-terminal domain/Protein of unknown function (DUF559)